MRRPGSKDPHQREQKCLKYEGDLNQNINLKQEDQGSPEIGTEKPLLWFYAIGSGIAFHDKQLTTGGRH